MAIVALSNTILSGIDFLFVDRFQYDIKNLPKIPFGKKDNFESLCR